jgi:hypothetical protein
MDLTPNKRSGWRRLLLVDEGPERGAVGSGVESPDASSHALPSASGLGWSPLLLWRGERCYMSMSEHCGRRVRAGNGCIRIVNLCRGIHRSGCSRVIGGPISLITSHLFVDTQPRSEVADHEEMRWGLAALRGHPIFESAGTLRPATLGSLFKMAGGGRALLCGASGMTVPKLPTESFPRGAGSTWPAAGSSDVMRPFAPSLPPHPLGLALDTFVFGALWSLLLFAPGFVRSRLAVARSLPALRLLARQPPASTPPARSAEPSPGCRL